MGTRYKLTIEKTKGGKMDSPQGQLLRLKQAIQKSGEGIEAGTGKLNDILKATADLQGQQIIIDIQDPRAVDEVFKGSANTESYLKNIAGSTLGHHNKFTLTPLEDTTIDYRVLLTEKEEQLAEAQRETRRLREELEKKTDAIRTQYMPRADYEQRLEQATTEFEEALKHIEETTALRVKAAQREVKEHSSLEAQPQETQVQADPEEITEREALITEQDKQLEEQDQKIRNLEARLARQHVDIETKSKNVALLQVELQKTKATYDDLKAFANGNPSKALLWHLANNSAYMQSAAERLVELERAIGTIPAGQDIKTIKQNQSLIDFMSNYAPGVKKAFFSDGELRVALEQIENAVEERNQYEGARQTLDLLNSEKTALMIKDALAPKRQECEQTVNTYKGKEKRIETIIGIAKAAPRLLKQHDALVKIYEHVHKYGGWQLHPLYILERPSIEGFTVVLGTDDAGVVSRLRENVERAAKGAASNVRETFIGIDYEDKGKPQLHVRFKGVKNMNAIREHIGGSLYHILKASDLYTAGLQLVPVIVRNYEDFEGITPLCERLEAWKPKETQDEPIQGINTPTLHTPGGFSETQKQVATLITQYLQNHGGSATVTDICEYIKKEHNIPRGTTSPLCSKMTKAGMLHKLQRGRYGLESTLTSEQNEAVPERDGQRLEKAESLIKAYLTEHGQATSSELSEMLVKTEEISTPYARTLLSRLTQRDSFIRDRANVYRLPHSFEGTTRDAILHYIRDSSAKTGDILKAVSALTGRSKFTVKDTLKAMKKEGTLSSPQMGFYETKK